MVGSCEIDTDEFDDVVDWRCTTNFPGVSLICLVNGVPVEDCICEEYIERYHSYITYSVLG